MPMPLFILLGALLTFSASASSQDESLQRPLIQVDVSVDMDAINESLKKTSESVSEISESFRLVAQGGQLNPEQQQHLVHVIENLDAMVEATRLSVDAMPSLVQRSRQSLSDQSTLFFQDLKFWSLSLLALLCAALIAAIICFYYFVLRPLQRTAMDVTANISDMAKAMENTSRSLEISSETQRELLKLSQGNQTPG
jgi:hypothetical protein